MMVLPLPLSYRVCEVLYGKKRQFSNVLSCYWRDPNRKVTTAHVDKKTISKACNANCVVV